MDMGRTFSKHEGQHVGQTQHRGATKVNEGTKGTTKPKIARGRTREGGTAWNRKALDKRQWKALVEDYMVQSMDRA